MHEYTQTLQNVNADNIKPEQSNLFVKDPSKAVLHLSIRHDHTFFADQTVGVVAMSLADLQVGTFVWLNISIEIFGITCC